MPQPTSDFYREYDLTEARKFTSKRNPARHQKEALEKLSAWFEKSPTPAGGLLVLPTGGGKTFTTVRSLCTGPLSQSYKVLWLAHTHHLLDQALYNFGSEVSGILEPKRRLNIRVVSGGKGYFPVSTIKTSDDVIIATLQTVTRAYRREHPQLMEFLDSARGKLYVVFDEAHHTPAPSYFRLLESLFGSYASMYLLGLTATPTYTDETKQGRLANLFQQGIIYQVSPTKLMAEEILARPIFEQHQTQFEVEFDEREYRKWVNTYQDLPDDLINCLATSQERNAFIVKTYVENKDRYGKTIIFADRIAQCEQLRDFLKRKGIRADAVYFYVGADAEGRQYKERNAKVLEDFRNGKLDVLVNVRMLTEGTDVPDIDTVFLTRQTTSQILITQMVGRALRGPKFGGTENAYIVSFIDNWKHLINWAEYDPLEETPVEQVVQVLGKRPPLQLISIELIRQLIRKMEMGPLSIGPYLTYLPIGWYGVDFRTVVNESENHDDESGNPETIRLLVMVFEKEKECYEQFIDHLIGLSKRELEGFEDEGVRIGQRRNYLEDWQKRFFSQVEEHIGGDLDANLFHIARHVAQNRRRPAFFDFEDRKKHNLDALAQEAIDKKIGLGDDIELYLRPKYDREDQYWNVFYPNYEMFEWEFLACVWFVRRRRHLEEGKPPSFVVTPEPLPPSEPPDEIKRVVKERDDYRCLCCGEDDKRRLEVDHIRPRYYGIDHSLANLQTLCKICNGSKGDQTINFQAHRTSLTSPPSEFRELGLPQASGVYYSKVWERFLRRSINFFYGCSAVQSVDRNTSVWHVTLHTGNKLDWLEPHLDNLEGRINEARRKAGLQEIRVKVSAAESLSKVYKIDDDSGVEPPIEPSTEADYPRPDPQLISETALILVTRSGQRNFIKRIPASHDTFPTGITNITIHDQGTIGSLLAASPSDKLLLFTDQGRVYAQQVQDIPISSPASRDALIAQFLKISSEKITAAIAVPGFAHNESLILLTHKGRIKRLRLYEFASIRSGGAVVLNLGFGDELGWVKSVRSGQEVVVVSRGGQAIRFETNAVRITGRNAVGVRAMKLKNYDRVAGMDIINSNASFLLVATERGFANCIPLHKYSTQNRDGTGKRTFSKSMQRTGKIVAAHVVSSQDDIILISKGGTLLRKPVREIPTKDRTSQGTRIVELKKNDVIVAGAVLSDVDRV